MEFHHATRLARKGRALEVIELGTTAETFKARNKEMGVVFVSCHLGNWELLPIGLRRIGITGYAVAQPRPNPRVDRYLTRLRELFGQRILDNKGSFRNLVRLLRAGKNIGLIVDQNDRMSSLLVDFFGRQATANRGPALLARRVGCPIVPFFIRRVPGVNRHVMSIRDPIQAIKTRDAEADIRQMTQAYTRVFEEMIRKTPEQWLWLHRHWRTRPPEEKEATRLPRHTNPPTEGRREAL